MNSKMILLGYFSVVLLAIVYFFRKMKKDNGKWYENIADFIEEEDIKKIGREKLKAMINKSLWYMIGINILGLVFVVNYLPSTISISTSFIMVALPVIPMLVLEIKLQSFRMLEKDTK